MYVSIYVYIYIHIHICMYTGDYPGGSTGIPMDGYLAFETGHGTQPYHGTYAPMQVRRMLTYACVC